MRKIFLTLLVFTLIGFTVQAQETSQVGTSMANFLKIGVGPRAIGMGEAFVAMANDASAIYWNPAGLGSLTKNEVLAQTTTWIADTKLYFIGLAIPLGDYGTLGTSVYAFSSGEMEETTLDQPDGTGKFFDAGDFALSVSYAKSLTDRFLVGLTVKYINESLSRESADAFAFDIGSIFTTSFLNDMKIGITLSNLGSPMKLDGPDLIVSHDIAPGVPTNKMVDASLATQSWDLPLTFRIGVGSYIINNENTSVSLEATVVDTRDYLPRYNVGSELSLNIIGNQKLMLRAGYKGNYDEEGLTMGGGLFLNLASFDFKLDYAFADFSRLGNTHRYSVSILF